MKIKFREKRFSASNAQLLEHAQQKIGEYENRGIMMTLRQLYYQLVAGGIIPNNIRSYKHLASIITDARYAGLVDWNVIEDNLRKPEMPNTFSGIPAILNAAIHSFKLDYWKEMPEYVELYTEKDALSSILAPIAMQFRIPFQVNRGYASASSMFEAAQRFIEAERRGQSTTILYLGDHDPSGLDMVRDISARLREFGVEVDVQHIALTREQIVEYNPPPNPAKLTDARAQGYIAEHGEESWEVDALPPEAMIELVKSSIEAHIDEDIRDKVLAREDGEKAELKKFAAKYEKKEKKP